MGLLAFIKRVFNYLFGNVKTVKYDDSDIIKAIQAYPKTLNNSLCNQIRAIASDIHQVYEAANKKEITIGIIGDFSTGKSSFVNGILGKRIMPVSANPSTAVITNIRYGKRQKVIVMYNDNREVEMTHDEFIVFSKFSLNDFIEQQEIGKIQRFKEIKHATIFVKSKFLKDNNLCLVDTIGLSANENDNKKTIATIKDYIAIIYICEERGLSNKDINFISKYLNPGNGNFFFCINRIDLVKKNKRDGILQLVKFNLDNILHKSGCVNDFPIKRIYQVSSLYQEFANGFTDHEDWHNGIDYKSRSGFQAIMNDICNFVKSNSETSKLHSITKQLEIAEKQIQTLKSFREFDLHNLIVINESEIESINAKIQETKNKSAYIKTLFENLEKNIYSYFPNLFSLYLKEIDNEWKNTQDNLIDQFSFGFGDYIALKINVLILKLNIFKSMKDSRYTKLNSLSSTVNITLLLLQRTLKPIIDQTTNQILQQINIFAVKYSFQNIIEQQNTKPFSHTIENSIIYKNDLTNAMFRAAAKAAIESTWMKNRTRKLKMLAAAKDEAIKVMEKIFDNYTNEIFESIKLFIRNCESDATKDFVILVKKLSEQVDKKEQENSSLKLSWNRERTYFEHIEKVLTTSKTGL